MVHALYLRSEATNGIGRFCFYEGIMYFVYVLMSDKDKKFYIGFSENVERRIKDHNSSKVPNTKNRKPFKLIYYEGHLSEEDARRRERYLKTAKGKTTLKRTLKHSLEDLKRSGNGDATICSRAS